MFLCFTEKENEVLQGGLGFIFEGCFYLAAPWPVRDPSVALRLNLGAVGT